MRATKVLLFAFVVAGCNDPLCVALECQDEMLVTIVQDEDAPTAPGEYDVSITWGSHPEPVKLPRITVVESDGAMECSGGGATCGGDGQLVVDVAGHLDMEDGFADDPSELTIFVHSGETLIGQENANPTYEKYWCRPEYDECNDQENYNAEVTVITETP